MNLALPRVKDFRGLELSNIDESGNLNIGFKEHDVFPEIDQEKSKTSFGLQATIVPRKKNREAAIALYRRLRLPLKNKFMAKNPSLQEAKRNRNSAPGRFCAVSGVDARGAISAISIFVEYVSAKWLRKAIFRE